VQRTLYSPWLQAVRDVGPESTGRQSLGLPRPRFHHDHVLAEARHVQRRVIDNKRVKVDGPGAMERESLEDTKQRRADRLNVLAARDLTREGRSQLG
jgi:hypothetical protein